MDAFLVTCLLAGDELIDDDECERISENLKRVVTRGREPGLALQCSDSERSLAQWGQEILDMVSQTATVLDKNEHGSPFSDAVAAQRLKLDDPALTPSAQILAQLLEQKISHSEFSLAQSRAHRETLLKTPLSEKRQTYFSELTGSSLNDQARIEAEDSLDFDHYLADYLAQ
jgi:glutamate--cysteine ligase